LIIPSTAKVLPGLCCYDIKQELYSRQITLACHVIPTEVKSKARTTGFIFRK